MKNAQLGRVVGRKKVLGRKKVDVPAGNKATIRIKLNRTGRKLFRRRPTKLVLVVSLGDGRVVRRNVRVRRTRR